jgi:hypothetical protein
MNWQQHGSRQTSGQYTIVDHHQDGKRWFTLAYGAESVGGGYLSLENAKNAALDHHQRVNQNE